MTRARWLAPWLALACAPAARAQKPSPLWEDVAHPNRPRCLQLTEEARRRYDGRELERALDLAQAAARLCPSDRDAQALTGQLRLELRDYAGAREPLERARALEDAGQCQSAPAPCPRDGRLAFQLGIARSFAGDFAGALAELRRAEAQLGAAGSDAWKYWDNLGDVLMALGRLDEAIPAYRRAVRAAPYESVTRLALAVALDRDGEPDRAYAEVRQVLKADPELRRFRRDGYIFVPPGDVHYYEALLARVRGRPAEAKKLLEAFLKAVPDSPYAARARKLIMSGL